MSKKPTALKIIEGNLGRRPLPTNEPKPRPVSPDPMPGLLSDGKKTFNKLSKRLARIGIVTEADGDTLSVLAQLRERIVYVWGMQKKVQAALAKDLKSDDEKKIAESEKRVLTWMAQERLYTHAFRVAAGEFGMTPRGRVGLAVSTDNGTGDEDLLT